MNSNPVAGLVATTGPFQARVTFDGRSVTLSSGLSFSQNLRLEIVDTPNPFGPGTLTGNVVAACGVTLFMFVPSGQ